MPNLGQTKTDIKSFKSNPTDLKCASHFEVVRGVLIGVGDFAKCIHIISLTRDSEVGAVTHSPDE